MEALEPHPLEQEVRLYSGGQFVLPLTDESASSLMETYPLGYQEKADQTVFQIVDLYDGRKGMLIPGGRDEDHDVNTSEDNYNRGNVLIILPPTEQASTALAMQVDTRSNWLAQFRLEEEVDKKGGIPAELVSYLLYNPDAQRSEGHGMSTMESMFQGSNCQGLGCRTTDGKTELARIAGIGVYVIQLEPKSNGVRLLASTVMTDADLAPMFVK